MKLLLKILTLTSLACGIAPTVEAVVLDHIVAVVNNEAITERDLSLSMRRQPGMIGKKAPAPNRKEALDSMIQEKLLAQAMSKSNIIVNEEDINRAMRNLMRQYGMSSMDQLRAAVAKEGLSFDQYRENLKRHIQQIKFINQEVGSQIKISDQDLEDYYRQHMKKFSGTSAVHLAEIVFPINNQMTQTEGHALQEKIKGIAAKLNRSNFKQLARQYSQGPNADQGGDIGVVDPKSLPPEVAAAIMPLHSGEITQPVVTRDAIVIAMVVDRGEATDKDFERLKDQIYNILYDQRMQDTMKSFVAHLRQQSYVQIND